MLASYVVLKFDDEEIEEEIEFEDIENKEPLPVFNLVLDFVTNP